MLKEYLENNNNHHAYLIEGEHEKVVPEIFEFVESLGIKVLNNPDVCHLVIDNFKIDDAFSVRDMAYQSGFSLSHSFTGEAENKKIFIICANNFTLDAEQALLKLFEDPVPNTLFYIIIPDVNVLLKTVVSRFHFISARSDLAEGEAEKFIKMSLQNRINFIKELLAEEEAPTKVGVLIEIGKESQRDSSRSKAISFLNSLECVLHNKISRTTLHMGITYFKHFFKIREFLRQPGSSVKSLMESVALVVPIL